MSEQGKFVGPSSKSSVSSETMPSTSKTSSSLSRIQRNVAEKQRRDKLNGYISELANIVPMVSMSSKRLDKTSILRLSAAHLRLSKSPLSGSKKLKKSFKWCPSFLTAQQVREILESVDGFLIVTSSSGKILFTSSSVERYLGHQNIDMIGHSLFVFVHPDDLESVKDEMEKLLNASLKYGGSGPGPRCSFRCRMKEKGQPRSEVATYQFVHFAGDMTISDEEDGSNKNSKSTAVVTHIFKAFVKVVDANPYNELSLEDATADEYVTRHSLDGTIIFADHRLSTITGHLPQEVIGCSAYKYILPEDISVALFAHHLMFSSDKGTGMIVYRLRTHDDKFVYLKSVGCLQFDRATSQVDHFVCVNQHLSDAEGEAQLKYFVDRFIPHIRDSSVLTLFESVKALQMIGIKPPNSVGGMNEDITFSKFSPSESKVLKPDISSNKVYSKNSKSSIANSLALTQTVNSSENSSASVSKSVVTFQMSSLKKMSVDKSVSTAVSPSYLSKPNQYMNKSTSDTECRKKALNNVSAQALPDFKPLKNNINSSSESEKLLQMANSNSALRNGLITQKINSSNRLLISSISANNVSIKKEVSGSNDSKNDHTPSEYHNADTACYQEIMKNANMESVNNSNLVQMHVPSTSTSHSMSDSSLHALSQTNDLIHNNVHSSISKADNLKSHPDSKIPTITNMSSMKADNFSNIKTDILLSTGSVSYKNNISQRSPSTDNRDLLRLESDKFLSNESNEKQLSTLVVETCLWPTDTSSESSASNTITDEAFSSPMEGTRDDPNLYFMPVEDMKGYFEGGDDISSLLNSTLPFDESSLPSVDGWSEYLRPEDVLCATNEMHIDGE